MHVVELLERLAAQGIELVWYDRAGPVWHPGHAAIPSDALPWIRKLNVELQYAVRGAGTGHRWGACDKCDMAQIVPNKEQAPKKQSNGELKYRTCKVTPHCTGRMGRWVDLPTARGAWDTLRSARKLAVARSAPRLKLPDRPAGRPPGPASLSQGSDAPSPPPGPAAA